MKGRRGESCRPPKTAAGTSNNNKPPRSRLPPTKSQHKTPLTNFSGTASVLNLKRQTAFDDASAAVTDAGDRTSTTAHDAPSDDESGTLYTSEEEEDMDHDDAGGRRSSTAGGKSMKEWDQDRQRGISVGRARDTTAATSKPTTNRPGRRRSLADNDEEESAFINSYNFGLKQQHDEDDFDHDEQDHRSGSVKNKSCSQKKANHGSTNSIKSRGDSQRRTSQNEGFELNTPSTASMGSSRDLRGYSPYNTSATNGKIKVTKMEKIRQLQEKNSKYKEEYKRIYYDKKDLKKKYEDKKRAVSSLAREIDAYMTETGLLKQQLADATKQLEKTGGEGGDLAYVNQLQAELRQTRKDLREALTRIADRKSETEQLREVIQRKDEQIESLTLEVATQIDEVQNLQAKVSIEDCGSNDRSQKHHRQNNRSHENARRGGTNAGGDIIDVTNSDADLEKLRLENEMVKAELSLTLNRAAEMVKERERSISTLRKENNELKELMERRNRDGERHTATQQILNKEQEIRDLKAEIAGLKELRECPDSDKQKLQGIVDELEQDVEGLQEELEDMEKQLETVENELKRANAECEERDKAITELRQEAEKLESSSKQKERELNKATHMLTDREASIEQLRKELDGIKKIQKASSNSLEDTTASLKAKEEEIKELHRENEVLKSSLTKQKEEFNKRRKAMVRELEEAKMNEKVLQEELEEASEMVKAREDAIEDLLKEVDALKEDKDVNESEVRRNVFQREENIIDMMKQVDDIKRQMRDKDHDMERTQRVAKEREAAINDLMTEMDELKQRSNEAEKQLAERAEEVEHQIGNQNKELRDIQQMVEELALQRDEFERRLAIETDKVKEREGAIEDLLQDIDDIKEKQLQDQLEKEELKRQLSEEEQRRLQLSRELAEDKNGSSDEVCHELEYTKKALEKKEEKMIFLLQENSELKVRVQDLLSARQDTSTNIESQALIRAQEEVMTEEIDQLTDQIKILQEEFGEAQRQNAILNEEVEDHLQRGGGLEAEIQRLMNELELTKERADRAEAIVENAGTDSDLASVGGHSMGETGNQQDMLLQKAMEERKRKNVKEQGKGVWSVLFSQGEEVGELDENQKRIKELERIKDEQEQQIQSIKSDLVKLTTAHRNESYTNKKKIADLESSNDAYKAQIEILLRQLEMLKEDEEDGYDDTSDDESEEYEDEEKKDEYLVRRTSRSRASSTTTRVMR